jgi:phenylpyruvate tautomerase PptA (4-oxalocrotonate tautomerase family)
MIDFWKSYVRTSDGFQLYAVEGTHMPITVTAPRDVLTADGERQILPQLTAALIQASGATGNTFFTPLVGGTVHILEREHVYAGGKNEPIVMVELKLPNIGLATAESREQFIKAATDIVDNLTTEGHRREHTWINILNARDGAWGVAGLSYTDEALIAGITAAM